MHKDYFEPTLNRFRCILIWIWRIWCMTYKYVISGGWRSYFLCSFIEVPKAYCNIPIHHHKLFINPVTWERTTLTLIQCRGGSNLEKIWFFGVKSWFFTRNTPKLFAPPSARRNFFKCAPPPNLNPGSAPGISSLVLNNNHHTLLFVFRRSVVFSGYSSFLHQ